jgi:alanyl-tRNA synthetase
LNSNLRSDEVRERYLGFFEERGHKRLPSDSLVPTNDPTLLFTGAGMNQFKESFLGKGNLPWKRVTTSQKCLRVPDLENVGRTPRHHTFFEMLGNFSFGEYFKKECIRWEWEFFTQALGIPKDRLWATVYLDDDEAFSIWKDDIGLPAERIYRFGEKENFWPASAPSQGPNGPCGPCSEIYFDQQPGGPPPSREGLESMPDTRFLEVGNCVFTQFDRRDGAPGKGGELRPLPQKNIDVGLGFERIVAVLQGAPNNFETDLFQPYLRDLEKRSHKKYETASKVGIRMRRIADHLRAVTFCIADGARPGNEGRGYVVRKILRRACRDLYELGLEEPTLHAMVPIVGETMGDAYPDVRQGSAAIATYLKGEEERFREVYVRGIDRLEELFETSKAKKTIGGADAFLLHDTLGFPIDLIEQIAEERGFGVDMKGFERAMESQRERARAGSSIAKDIFVEGPDVTLRQQGIPPSAFTGYADTEAAYRDPARLEVAEARIVGIIAEDATTQRLQVLDPTALPPGGHDATKVPFDEKGAPAQRPEYQRINITSERSFQVVLDRTPFYAEGGGQVGDAGTIESLASAASGGRAFALDVVNTTRRGAYIFHECKSRGPLASLELGDRVRARVDASARLSTERHHTATHLLHLALRKILGDHVNQAGSLVGPEKLRFDFTHGSKLTPEQIRAIEDFVNERILAATPVSKETLSMEDAKKRGAVMLFGEKYGDRVRVLGAADSLELCGGTHVGNTGNIGGFKITSEASAAAGIRRIEAISGPLVDEALGARERLLEEIGREVESQLSETLERVRQLKLDVKKAKDSKQAETKSDRPGAPPQARPKAPIASADEPKNTTRTAVDRLRERESLLDEIGKELKSPQGAILDRIRQLKTELRQAKESKATVATLDRGGALTGIRAALVPIPDGVGGSVVLAGFPAADLRSLVDELKKDLPNFAVALIVPEESQVSFVVAAHGAPGKRLKAGEVAKAMGAALGGGGGGRPDFAQGQGKNPAGAAAAAKQALSLFTG